MFRRRPSYYKSYRGRKSPREKKLIALSVIILIIIALGAGFFFLQGQMVFSSDGFSFLFQKDDTPPPPPEDEDDDEDEDFNIVINEKPLTPDIEPGSEDVPIEAPRILGVQDGIGNLLKKGYAKGLAKAASDRSCNTLCFEVKGSDGVMRVPLTSSYSVQGSQSADANDIKAVLLSLKDEGLHLAARVSAFSDNITPRSFRENAVTASGSLWLDKNKISRIDPYSPMAADYLCDVISSCAASGFDMVIIDDLSFPSEGRTDIAEYNAPEGADDRFAAINSVLEKASHTASSEGLMLAVVLDDKSAENSTTGQRVSDLAKYCSAVFYEGDSDRAFNEVLKTVLANTKCRTGVINKGAYAEPQDDISIISGYLK